MDIWAVSSWSYYETFLYKYFREYMFSFLLGKHLGVEMLGHGVGIHLLL